MKPPDFGYVRADTLADAVEALAGNDGESEVKVLAGGQSLVPLMNFRLARPSALVDINGVKDQSYHLVADGQVKLGALCRHRDVEFDEDITGQCDAIREAVPLIGHVAIRNRGTVLGSVVHGDPLGEWSSLAVLLGARIELQSARGTREVPADQWFQGFFETAIRPDELATSITFDIPESIGATGTAFAEVARRHGDFCLVSAAAMVRFDDDDRISQVRLVVGGLQATPWQPSPADLDLAGRSPADDMWEHVAGSLPAETEIASDLHASAAVRRQMAQTLVRRVLAGASGRAGAAHRRSTHNGN